MTTYYFCYKCGYPFESRRHDIKINNRRCPNCRSWGNWLVSTNSLKEVIKLAHRFIIEGKLDPETIKPISPGSIKQKVIKIKSIEDKPVVKNGNKRMKIPENIINDFVKFNRKSYSIPSIEGWIKSRYRIGDYHFPIKTNARKIAEALKNDEYTIEC